MDEKDFRVPTSPTFGLPLPTPEHQRKITRNKWFEVITVILMIVIGFGYLAWRNSGTVPPANASNTLQAAITAVKADGATQLTSTTIGDRTMVSLSKKLAGFDCNVEVLGKSPNEPLETAIIWLAPPPGAFSPSDSSMLEVVNGVGELGHKLVPSTADAMEKAVKTSELIKDAPRPHQRGVAATNDGWKVTYVTYQNYDETANPTQAVLYYVIQRLSAGEDESLGPINRALHKAILEGTNAVQAIQLIAKIDIDEV
ncbi:MAG: hypothetical protein IT367_08295 [Candidatus Hydrogenedentes bacterium]|nr:hypothetical protein [Candidatus Hydrogenedentota bacterium]